MQLQGNAGKKQRPVTDTSVSEKEICKPLFIIEELHVPCSRTDCDLFYIGTYLFCIIPPINYVVKETCSQKRPQKIIENNVLEEL